MASEVSTIQSLKAVDAWIDVINANINGGVRTAFKSSRLKFSGSNVDVSRAGNATSLPLQFPEPGLTTANTVIDFSQGAITASTENVHLAIQGEGFFMIASPDMINRTAASATFGGTVSSANARLYLTRDGEFRTDQNGFLVHSSGYYLVSARITNVVAGQPLIPDYDLTATFGNSSLIRAVYNNVDLSGTAGIASILSEYLIHQPNQAIDGNPMALTKVTGGKQSLQYSSLGSTVFDFGWRPAATKLVSVNGPGITLERARSSDATILTKSLEASNASMTQSVPELSLAQKLFSALTKVLQTKQTNVDGVLNLVR